MHILVINGSPKGDSSITLQTVRYLEILHPELSFEILNVGAKISLYEKDFSDPTAAFQRADLLLFSYPVYTFLVPSQLHRFIELMKRNSASVEGKYCAQLSTSKHFYDITANRFIKDNCQDLGMKYLGALSADMDDLTTPSGQKNAEDFLAFILWNMKKEFFEPIPQKLPKPELHRASVPEPRAEKSGDVVIVADLASEDEELQAMIDRFQAVSPNQTRLVNIHDFPFKGGCISCFNCASDGTCIYKDGFSQLLRENIQTADAIVIAFTICDHSMGSVFKTYDDRQFCNGHRTVTMGKPFGYLVSGALSREENLRTVIEARAQVGGNYLAGIGSNEADTDHSIDAMAERLAYAVEHSYVQPSNFYGVGGMKIFRDLIWLMQGLMRADHRFYKSHGQYDFPQKKTGKMAAMYLVGALMNNQKLKQKAGSKVTEGMLAPYTKVLNQAKKEKGIS
ncbi:MAG: NAD(P)H-dependent oxidoreductase [Eubacteriales bacterium]|nr:NAD(P)H-dependent oxidoreductase [Eubacteriales bacterium]